VRVADLQNSARFAEVFCAPPGLLPFIYVDLAAANKTNQQAGEKRWRDDFLFFLFFSRSTAACASLRAAKTRNFIALWKKLNICFLTRRQRTSFISSQSLRC